MNKGFQNGIGQFEKKITPSLPISFHSFGNLKKVCKKLFFHGDMIALAAYAEQLLPRGKAGSVLHYAARHSVDAPLGNRQVPSAAWPSSPVLNNM